MVNVWKSEPKWFATFPFLVNGTRYTQRSRRQCESLVFRNNRISSSEENCLGSRSLRRPDEIHLSSKSCYHVALRYIMGSPTRARLPMAFRCLSLFTVCHMVRTSTIVWSGLVSSRLVSSLRYACLIPPFLRWLANRLTHYFLHPFSLLRDEQLCEINYSPAAFTRIHIARFAALPSPLLFLFQIEDRRWQTR